MFCSDSYVNFWKLSFQDPVTPIAYGIIKLHDHILFFLAIILFVVSYLLYSTYKHFYYGSLNFNYYYNNTSENTIMEYYRNSLVESVKNKAYNITHGTVIEIVWTILPAFVLLLIAIPSFALLYAMDEIIDPVLTVKVIGHQWY